MTKNKVHTDQFAPYVPSEVEHISLAQKADLFLVAPASADFIAKAAINNGYDMDIQNAVEMEANLFGITCSTPVSYTHLINPNGQDCQPFPCIFSGIKGQNRFQFF